MEDRKHFNPDDFLDRAVDSVLRSPIPDELPADQVAGLVAVVRQAADQSYPITLIERIKNMKPITRIAVAASVLIVLVGLLSLFVPGAGTARAFADVAEAINGIRTATWKVTQTVPQPDGKPIIIRQTGMFMAPYKERTETLRDNNVASIQILDGQKEKMLGLSVPLKIAIVTDLENVAGQRPSFVVLRETIAKAKKGGKDGEVQHLGFETIDGHRTEVFLVRSKILPNMKKTSETKLWVDPKTSLPVRVRRARVSDKPVFEYLMTDFHYDVPLAPDLFSVEAPKGYYVQQAQPDLSVTYLAEALGIVAKYNGGVFPPGLTGVGGIDGYMERGVDDLFEKHGIETEGTGGMPRKEDMEKFQRLRKEDIEEIQKALTDLSTSLHFAMWLLDAIGRHGEWHYAGGGVKLNSPNRPIFWYKMGNDCEVIYADLSIKKVSPQDVPKVPESEGSTRPQETKGEKSP